MTDLETGCLYARSVAKRPAVCIALRDAWVKSGLKQNWIAEQLGITPKTLSRYFDSREPDLQTLSAIESVLGLKRGEILKRAGYANSND